MTDMRKPVQTVGTRLNRGLMQVEKLKEGPSLACRAQNQKGNGNEDI